MGRFLKVVFVMIFIGLMMFAFWSVRPYRAATSSRLDQFGDRWNVRSSANRANDDSQLAEVVSDSQIVLDALPGEEKSSEASASILPTDRPDWVVEPQDTSSETHHLVIATPLESSLADSQAQLSESLEREVYLYLEKQIGTSSPKIQGKLKGLTVDWIKRELLNPNLIYEAEIVRPSGTYYQVWRRLDITPDDRAQLATWIRQVESTKRTGIVGLAMLGMTGIMLVSNLLLRFLEPKHS